MNINKVLLEGLLGDGHNFNYGRGGNSVDKIIIHTMVGSMDGSESRFRNPGSGVAVQYGIALSGEIRQWIDEGNTAWQAGNWAVNLTSIGIEHEDLGNYNDPVRTDELYNSSSDLVADICRRYGIPADRSHILKHSEVIDRTQYKGGTGCCDGLDIDRIVREAEAKLNGTVAASEPAPSVPVASGDHIHLPVEAPQWRVYPLDKLPRVGNEVAYLRPAMFGGLDYDVVAWPYPNVATIQTRDFGQVNIYVGSDTGAVVSTNAPAPAPAPEPAPAPAPEVVVPVTTEPVPDTTDFKDTYKKDPGTFKATKDLFKAVVDFEGKHPNASLGHDQTVHRAGTFTVDGKPYARTIKSVEHDVWYGIPADALIPVNTSSPAKYVGKLVQDIKVFPNKEIEDINKIAQEVVQDPAYKEFHKQFSGREKTLATIAHTEDRFIAVFSKLRFFKKRK